MYANTIQGSIALKKKKVKERVAKISQEDKHLIKLEKRIDTETKDGKEVTLATATLYRQKLIHYQGLLHSMLLTELTDEEKFYNYFGKLASEVKDPRELVRGVWR